MNRIVKIISAKLSESKRFIKYLGLGKSDVQEKRQLSSFGDDSSPLKEMYAVVCRTGENGQDVVLGYLGLNQKSAPGEKRIYSLQSDGSHSIDIYLRGDGTMEIGGNSNFAVRYNELESAFNQLKADHNSLLVAFNAHQHPTAATGPPSPPVPIPGSIPAQASLADITGAKNDKVKTN